MKEQNKRPRIITKQQSEKAKKVSPDQIQQVFDYWKQTIAPQSRAVLDNDRSRKIGWAIYDYGIDACKQAVDGIAKSDWHMGRNPNNKKYNDVELIFRNATNVEKFIEMAGTGRDSRTAAREKFLADPEW